ncbi:hypothetical protein [Helicobacter cholecystus]|uniref:hypothetical protein n=1 Tax=Helicobacter cholecystus TaxID=45498 RepID=UPI0027383E2E|nr:hypothetical protein [Helicobacter cholecystus]
MKKIFTPLLFFVWLFANGPASSGVNIIPKDKVHLGGELNIGIDYYQYKEPNVMSISGPMLGVDGNFALGYKFFKFQLDGFFSSHLKKNAYKGGLFNSVTGQSIPYNTDSEDWYLGVATRFGVAFNLNGREVVFVYGGFGYRYLHNMMIDQPGIKASYERGQEYIYFLAGLDGEIPINRVVSIIGELQYRQLIYGYQVSGMSDLGYDSDFYFTQTNGMGGRVSLGGKFYLPNQMAFKLKIYFDFWGIEDSDLVQGYRQGQLIGNFVEPKNTTKVVGMSLGLTF